MNTRKKFNREQAIFFHNYEFKSIIVYLAQLLYIYFLHIVLPSFKLKIKKTEKETISKDNILIAY